MYLYIYVYKSFWAGFITFQLENQITSNKTLHRTKTLYYMDGKHHLYYKMTFQNALKHLHFYCDCLLQPFIYKTNFLRHHHAFFQKCHHILQNLLNFFYFNVLNCKILWMTNLILLGNSKARGEYKIPGKTWICLLSQNGNLHWQSKEIRHEFSILSLRMAYH